MAEPVDYSALAAQARGGQPQGSPGFLANLWHEAVVNPAKQVAAGAVGAEAGANHLTANVFDLLDHTADAVAHVTGTTKGHAFKTISDWARGNQAAEERQAQQLSEGRTDLPSQLYRGVTQGVLSVPTAAVASETAGPVAGFAALGAIQESDRGWLPALKAAAEGALTGWALQVIGPASRPVRLTGMGASTYAQSRLNGDDNATALAKATTMGVIAGAPAGGVPANEIAAPVTEAIGDAARAMRPTVKSTLNPTQQGAVDYLRSNDVPLNAGTVTGNKFVKGAQALVANTPLGAGVAADATRATEAGLARVAGELADQAHPAPATPESAGAAVSDALLEKIAGLKIQEDESYGDAWKGAEDPQYAESVPVRTEQRPVLDAEGKPTGKTQSAPVMASVQMPVDVRGIKEQLGPVWESMQWMPAADQASNAGFAAAKKILNGPDFIPAPAAEQGLGGLKEMARVGNTNLRNAAQGMAAGIIPDLQDAIDAAVAKTGPDALTALQDGRATHATKMEVSEVSDKLRNEPVQAFQQATYQQDTGIGFLRRIADQAPDALPKIGRAFIQKLFDQAAQEGGFSRSQGVARQWENLGPQTKQLLYPNPGLRGSLDNFFLGAKMAAENPNPSGTALVNQVSNSVAGLTGAGGGVGLYLHSPLVALGSAALEGGYLLGGRAVAKLLYSPAGVRLLTGGLKAEAPGAAAMRSAQILRIAGDDDVTPMPPPPARPDPSSNAAFRK
jgi:hypothetical protein